MAAPILARLMTAAQAKKFNAAALDRIAKRSARLKKQGINTKAMQEFEAIRSKVPTTRNEAVAKASQLAKLDRSPGLRSSTAGRVFAREQAAQARADLITAASNPATRRRMSAADLKEATRLMTKSLRGKVARTKKKYGETHATRKFDAYMASLPENPTRNQLASRAYELSRMAKWEGITVKGAEKEMQRGIKVFGDDYRGWTHEQRGAAWDQVNELSKEWSVSSGEALATVSVILRDQSAAFYRDAKGVLRAEIGQDPKDAKVKAARSQAREEVAARYQRDSVPGLPW